MTANQKIVNNVITPAVPVMDQLDRIVLDVSLQKTPLLTEAVLVKSDNGLILLLAPHATILVYLVKMEPTAINVQIALIQILPSDKILINFNNVCVSHLFMILDLPKIVYHALLLAEIVF